MTNERCLTTARSAQVRKLMAGRQEPGWQFATLFLVKDSLGVMLEAGGLLEDALREYFELEACFLEALSEGGALAGHAFGALAIHRLLVWVGTESQSATFDASSMATLPSSTRVTEFKPAHSAGVHILHCCKHHAPTKGSPHSHLPLDAAFICTLVHAPKRSTQSRLKVAQQSQISFIVA